MNWLLFSLGVSVAILWYTYSGYPLLLRLAVRTRGSRPVRKADITPSMSLIISAYNEESVIRKKLENALALDYPRGLLEVVVISDASTDRTDAIVSEFSNRGVKLARHNERRGKTAGLNRTVPTVTGDVIVFSDANAMYEPDALRKLARNFADPAVGCVTGEARYAAGGRAAAEVGERVYWGLEMQIKRLETALGSMVGGDGAIYAIRRHLWRELPENAINDFLNPLQIVAAGWRAVYEPDAVCLEETAGSIGAEYRRRVRIVSRSWRAVFQAYQVLNPRRAGLFVWKVFSHKMLRWTSGIFLAIALVAALVLYIRLVATAPLLYLLSTLTLVVAVVLWRPARQVASMMAYFSVINAASVVGVLKGTFGHVSGVWTPPRRPAISGRALSPRIIVPTGPFVLATTAVVMVSIAAAFRFFLASGITEIVFWVSFVMLAYIYVGYPALLVLLGWVASRPVRADAHEPTVCLFIAANDEGSIIEAKLRNTLELDYPRDKFEIVVASDGSLDETNAIAKKFRPRVTLFEFFPRRGKIAAINDGLRSVASDIVVFSDANTFVEPAALRAIVRNFADQRVGAVSGDVMLVGERAALGRSEDLYYEYERWMQRAESDIGSMIGADGALYAIRRELFVPPPNDTILDDMAIPMAIIRAGRRVVFEPAARATEQGSETAAEEFARKSRVIAGAMQFMARHDSAVPLCFPQVMLSLFSHKALRWFSPAFATCVFLTSAALADTSHGYATAALAQGAVLAVGAAGCAPRLRRIGMVALIHYFCLVQAAAMVGFLRGLSGRQSVLWRRFVRPTSAEPLRAMPR